MTIAGHWQGTYLIICGQASDDLVLVICFFRYLPDTFLPIVRDEKTIRLLTGSNVPRRFNFLHFKFLLKTKWIPINEDTNCILRRRCWSIENVDFISQLSHAPNRFVFSYVNSLSEVDGNRTNDWNLNQIIIYIILLTACLWNLMKSYSFTYLAYYCFCYDWQPIFLIIFSYHSLSISKWVFVLLALYLQLPVDAPHSLPASGYTCSSPATVRQCHLTFVCSWLFTYFVARLLLPHSLFTCNCLLTSLGYWSSFLLPVYLSRCSFVKSVLSP